MPSQSERMNILNRLERGEINPQEAARLLSAENSLTPIDNSPLGILAQLDQGEIDANEAAQRLEAQRPATNSAHANEKVHVRTITNEDFSPARTWGWWLIPIALGVVITLLSGLWMRNDLADGRLGFGFFLAWFPLILGVALIALGWLVRHSHWVQMRVKTHKPGRNINMNLKMPVPLTSLTKLMRGIGVNIPGLEKENMERINDALEEIRRNGQPVHIQANSEDGEDEVDIYIS